MKPATGLTKRQAEVLRFITGKAAYVSNASLREIAERFGFGSQNGPKGIVDKLIAKGFVARVEGDRKGGLRILRDANGEPVA